MVIKVSFSKKMYTSDVELFLVLTKFFEVDAMPEKPRIMRKLKKMGCECNPASVSVKIHDQDAAMMRSNGILVSELYKDTFEIAVRDATDSYAKHPSSDNNS